MRPHAQQKFLEAGESEVLMIRKVEHFLAEPIDSDDLVFEQMEVKRPNKVATMLKNADIRIVNSPGGHGYQQQNEEEASLNREISLGG